MTKRASYTLELLRPGIVVVHENGRRVQFTEIALKMAISVAERYRRNFKTDEAYQRTMSMYKNALKLLQEEQR
jgi:hypothetical protein